MEVKREVRQFLPKNAYTRNRDRHDPTSVIRLMDKSFLHYLSQREYVCHTIIPETVRYTDNNRLGMYPNIVNMTIGPLG